MTTKNTGHHLPKNPIAFALHITKIYWRWALAAVIAVVFGRGLETVLTYITKLLIDSITVVEDLTVINLHDTWMLLGVFLGISLLTGIAWRASGFMGMRWITRARAKSSELLFAYLSGHGSDYFSNRFAGSLTNKVSNVGRGQDSLLMSCLWNFLPITVQLVGAIFLTFLENWVLAAVLTLWTFIFIGINLFFAKGKIQLSEDYAESSSALHGQMVDIATNIAAVHHYSKRRAELTHLGKYILDKQFKGLRGWQYSEWVLVLNGFLQVLLTGLMFSGAIYLWGNEQITVGAVVMIITLTINTQHALFFIGMSMNNFMENYGQMKEGLEEIIVGYDIEDISDAKTLKVRKGGIDFSDVCFHYPKGRSETVEKNVLKKLILDIPGGQKIGIVGESGAGKSTLAYLLLRLYDIQKGQISIDAQDIAKVNQESLRERIAFVPQEPLLFHRTIKENIRYGKSNASAKEIEKVAKMAHTHEFIKDLPEKFDTYVGERGVKLSGGQKQRIAIARAMLKNAPILVLDEATSALDSESEALVQDALKHLMKGKTVLAIAHRLSTLLAMDRIIVLDKGKVVEDGTHKELLEKKGIYAKLWGHQAGGFIQ